MDYDRNKGINVFQTHFDIILLNKNDFNLDIFYTFISVLPLTSYEFWLSVDLTTGIIQWRPPKQVSSHQLIFFSSWRQILTNNKELPNLSNMLIPWVFNWVKEMGDWRLGGLKVKFGLESVFDVGLILRSSLRGFWRLCGIGGDLFFSFRSVVVLRFARAGIFCA